MPLKCFVPAERLLPGDRYRYLYDGKPEGSAVVSTREIEPAIAPGFRDSVYLQVEHSTRGRIAHCLRVGDTVELLNTSRGGGIDFQRVPEPKASNGSKPRVKRRLVAPAAIPEVKSKPKVKRRLVAPSSSGNGAVSEPNLVHFFQSLGIQPKKDATSRVASDTKEQKVPTIKRKR